MNTLRAATRAIRALMLITLLAAVIVGLPWGLWHFFGPPLPSHVPGYGDIKMWLDQAKLQPDQAAIQILDVAAWGYWALFTLQIALQLPGVTADTIRALRTRAPLPPTVHANLAGRLLSTVAISIIATRGTITAASAATASGASPPAAPLSIATATTNTTVHTVVAGDRLWDIAEHRLGDSHRWKEIYNLNRHRVQPDGCVLTDPNIIRPGWVLTLPGDVARASTHATNATPAPAVPAPSANLLLPTQVPAPQATSKATIPAAPVMPVSLPTQAVHQAPLILRRPVAVHLPTGGYVSLTLGAGLAAALAAARVRSRASARRRDPGEPRRPVEGLGEPEATLLQAAATLRYGRDIDPYIDDPADTDTPPIPHALAALRAPIAVYIGNHNGRPISLANAATGGLGLLGEGAHDTARALLTSALAAGGFLAGSAVYRVVTTTDDLYTLTGHKLAGPVNDRLTVYDTLDDALTAIAKPSSMEPAGHRPLLLATASTVGALSVLILEEIEAVLLGCPDAATTVKVDADGTITASGTAAPALDEAETYRLGLEEARTVMDRLLAAAPPAEPADVVVSDVVPDFTAQTPPSTGSEPIDIAEPDAIHPDVPETAQVTAAPPIPNQASGAAPAAPEAAITVNILGPLQVKAGDRDVTTLFRPLTAAMVIQLALIPRGVTRTAMAADLWPEPDLDPDARLKRFKATLSHVRRALAEAHGTKADHVLEARSSRLLTLNPLHITVDAWRFDQILEAAKPRIGREPSERAAALLEAIALYRGQVAHGHEHIEKREADEVWLTPHREDYFHKIVDAHTDAAALLRVSDPDRAIDLLERAAGLEPWNNGLSEQIIEIYVEQGQRHAAARRLAVLTEHLAALGMRPSASLISLVEAVAA